MIERLKKIQTFIEPYAGLARWQKPTGIYLLFFPCCWGLAIHGVSLVTLLPYLQFFIGSVLMRGAGCTLNDIFDRDFDAQVERTKSRPLACGRISVKKAWIFLGTQLFLSALLALTLRWQTVLGALLSLGLVALYPFAKRVTYFPQVLLGVVFNWGVFLGALEATGALTVQVFLVYGFGILWTVLYDTVYAFQDFKDDASAGVKSLTFVIKPFAKTFFLGVLGVCVMLLVFNGSIHSSGPVYYLGVLGALIWIGWEILSLEIDDPTHCLRFFKKCVLFNGLFYFLFLWSS